MTKKRVFMRNIQSCREQFEGKIDSQVVTCQLSYQGVIGNNTTTHILSVLSPTTHWNQAFQIVHKEHPAIDRPSF